ncbi:MAG: single-stranded DNA-binding protein, partial [Staphylococcus epidermidis]|nr:single-stranded DNA-binding protein [Staphylococcus epidermidis]
SGQNTSYNNNNSSNSNQSDNPFANANGPIDISDDDLPF